jgi:tetratricopeptide (TPR) repeat protein
MRFQPVSFVCLFGCIFLLGCGNRIERPPKPSYPQSNDVLFASPSVAIPSFDSLVMLTPSQVDDIHHFVRRDDIAQLPINKQAHAYLVKKLVNFNYEGENLSATEALAKGSGNCMTLALLSYAVARELDVEVVFQVMHTAPMLQEVRSGLAVTSDHVRTFLYEDKEKDERKGFYFSDRSYAVIDYFPGRYDRGGRIIDEDQFIAMYYRNLAADALLENNLTLSFELLTLGASYDADYAPILNMMAVVHRRAGDEDTAEGFYLYGLEVSESKIILLSNYHYLLMSQGKLDSAEQIKQTLLSLDDPTPYNWYLLGKSSLEEEDYASAYIYLRKFLKNSPYYHQAYIDLASAQYALGQFRAAEQSLKTALEYTQLSKTQRQYQAKLAWLQQVE